MSRSQLHDAAARHRSVAELLSDPRDRAIIKQYADEVDLLALREIPVPCPCSPMAAAAGSRLMVFSGLLKTIYQPDPAHVFEDLLDRLGDNTK